MKSVLISIKPEWCELIREGKKSVEVRKTRPKLQPPFKVYIYCTKGDSHFSEGDRFCLYAPPHDTPIMANQSVIGEFVCDCITGLNANNMVQAYFNNTQNTCLTDEEIKGYANGKKLYYWHISDLKIYDKPKYLGKFIVPANVGCCNEGKCRGCRYFLPGSAVAGIEPDCLADFNTDEYKPLRRAPQDWCYVKEVG